jgi:hypothetical protein
MEAPGECGMEKPHRDFGTGMDLGHCPKGEGITSHLPPVGNGRISPNHPQKTLENQGVGKTQPHNKGGNKGLRPCRGAGTMLIAPTGVSGRLKRYG